MTNVIACIDGSFLSEYVTDAAVWAANNIESPLTLLHSLEKSIMSNSDLSGSIGLGSREHLLAELTELDEKRAKLALEHGKDMLHKAKIHAEDQGAQNVSIMQRHGDLVDTLISLESSTKLVILGRNGNEHAMSANTIGSHIERAARALHHPLLITVGEFKAPSNFMIAYDGREAADNAIARIAQSSLLKGLTCHMVMAGEDTPARKEKFARAQAILEAENFKVNASLIAGDIYPVLTQYRNENNIELMVMGAYAHSKVRQFFVGSNTSKMIIESDIPLLILR
ncbi:Universal stress protein family protein [Marinomonas spartinae]|uniref:Universal stress protein family protein n=1 Tax=Marinomonas spartinae TaxID=1792290 RepID=A0A1A8TEX1_9GAMM|nr:universal stress protein [Marinomonas spartinae]SBS31849.1 Universal stress protein family protein [Marinomonas spartinae]SBS34122.1 Universal stress protein family protein [Marinomonas spartinae]